LNAPHVDPADAKERVRKKRRWILFGAWLTFVVVIITFADRNRLRGFFEWVVEHPGSDKLGHFVLIGGLAFMLNLALGMRRIALGPVHVALGGLLIAVAITMEEFSQLYIPSRKFDWGDLAANYAGILCAGWLASWWLRRVKK
jgi:VanZ family protein